MGIPNVTGKHIQLIPDVCSDMIQPTPGIERIVQNERTNIRTGLYKRLGKVGTDKTIRPGHKYFHGVTLAICTSVAAAPYFRNAYLIVPNVIYANVVAIAAPAIP